MLISTASLAMYLFLPVKKLYNIKCLFKLHLDKHRSMQCLKIMNRYPNSNLKETVFSLENFQQNEAK